MAKGTDASDAADASAEVRELKQVIAVLERACRQTLVYMDGNSCLDEYRLKGVLKQAVRESSKITNPRY